MFKAHPGIARMCFFNAMDNEREIRFFNLPSVEQKETVDNNGCEFDNTTVFATLEEFKAYRLQLLRELSTKIRENDTD